MTAVGNVNVRGTAGSLDVAYRALWVAVAFDFLAFGIGFNWDRMWHATHPFEDFFSPPHLFIYTMHFLATMTLAYVAFSPQLRQHFGDTFRLFPLPFPVPGAIAIAGGGFVLTALAGVFDGIWHTAFGLDETGWSFPHSMLGAGIFVAFVGIAACRWAIRVERPIGWGSEIAFGFLMMATAGERFTGPLGTNLSPATIEFARQIPVLAAEPAFQHTARIELAYDLDRMNALFVPLSSLSVGMAVALVRSFVASTPIFFLLTAASTWFTRIVPSFVPGIIFAMNGARRPPLATRAIAGAAFALAAAIVWRGTPGGIVLGTALFVAGTWIGYRVWDIVERPTRGAVLAFVTIFGVAYPAVTGAVDLYLRTHTP